jgi:HD-like signal output (HDOD) protein
MFPPDETVESRPINSMPDILEMVGLERSRNIGMVLNCINEETGDFPPFTFMPLWRHQLAVALIVDFMYDALELERTGLEFVAGAFHDVGKIIFAELFPEDYSYTVAQAFLYQKFLSTSERENFGIDHAELAAYWLRHHGLPTDLASAIFPHENRQKLKNGGVLDHAIFSANQLAKQIGIGFSGNVGLSSTPWQEMRSTQFVWEARGNRSYSYTTFTADFLDQFKSFPELLWVD